MRVIALGFMLSVLPLAGMSQYGMFDGTPRKVNMGVSIGLGGIHFLGKPAVEFKFHQVSLKATYGFYYYGTELQFELIESNSVWLKSKLNSKKNIVTLSFQRNKQFALPYDSEEYAGSRINDMYNALLGVKSYQSTRSALSIKAGVSVNRFTISSDALYPFKSMDIFAYGELSYSWYFLRAKK